MNDGKRQESAGSKAKDFITHTNSHIQSIRVSLCQFFTLQFPDGVIKRARRALHTQCSVLQGRNPESLVTGIQLDCLSFQKDILYLLYWSVSMSTLCFRRRQYFYLSRFSHSYQFSMTLSNAPFFSIMISFIPIFLV